MSAPPVYLNLFTDNSVTNNEHSIIFAASNERDLFLLTSKKAFESDKNCDRGNKSKLNKQTCFTVLVVGVMPPRGKCDVQCMPYHSTAK